MNKIIIFALFVSFACLVLTAEASDRVKEEQRLRRFCNEELVSCQKEYVNAWGVNFEDHDYSLTVCRPLLKACRANLEEKIENDKSDLDKCRDREKACWAKLKEIGYKPKGRSPRHIDYGPHISHTVMVYSTPLSDCQDSIATCESKVRYMEDLRKLEI